jgi:hypothetical protein
MQVAGMPYVTACGPYGTAHGLIGGHIGAAATGCDLRKQLQPLAASSTASTANSETLLCTGDSLDAHRRTECGEPDG